jgi:iron-sulfur cluster assembly protein|tara:strand:+ start:6841 stop:7197 length:357 start_codon:yes stop_codon:yes gene_type:complete
MINLTTIASKNFTRMAEDSEALDKHLRVTVTGGGCAGYEYKLTFDEPEKKDLIFEQLGVKICVDRKSHLLVDGLTIDWATDLSAPGPRFENPKASSTCGCSTSFNVKESFSDKPAWMP